MNTANQRPDIIQWYDKSVDRYLKIERLTGVTIAQKVTAGPYKNIHIAKRRPSIKDAKPVDKKQVAATVNAVNAVKKSSAKKKVRKPRKVNYLNNKDLLLEIAKSKEQDLSLIHI